MWQKLKSRSLNRVQAGQRYLSRDGSRRVWVVDQIFSGMSPVPHVNLRDAHDYQLSRMYAMSILLDKRYFEPITVSDTVMSGEIAPNAA